jgi:hypothetical protein
MRKALQKFFSLPMSAYLDAFQILIVLIFPSLFLMLGASSMTLGLLIASLAVVFIQVFKGIVWREGTFAVQVLLFSFFVLAHSFISAFVSKKFEWARAIGSLASVVFVLLSASLLMSAWKRAHPQNISYAIRISFYFLTALVILSFLGVPSLKPVYHSHPVVFFIEPSHFALAYLPLVAYEVLIFKGERRLFCIALVLFIALYMQSATLLIGIAIILMVGFPHRQLFLFLLISMIGFGLLDTSYYLSRVGLGNNGPNLSNLVLLQGWERASIDIFNTNGVGLGFQQFGVTGSIGEIQNKIVGIVGGYLNLNDGGTNASKLVGEFGAIGIGLIFIFIIIWFRQIYLLKMDLKSNTMNLRNVFLRLFFICYSVELFVRGVGYLSPSLFFLGMFWSAKAYRRSREV